MALTFWQMLRAVYQPTNEQKVDTAANKSLTRLQIIEMMLYIVGLNLICINAGIFRHTDLEF